MSSPPSPFSTTLSLSGIRVDSRSILVTPDESAGFHDDTPDTEVQLSECDHLNSAAPP